MFFGGTNGEKSRILRLNNLKASIFTDINEEEIAYQMFVDDIKELRT